MTVRAPRFTPSRFQQGLGLVEVMLFIFLLGGALVAGFVALKARETSEFVQRQASVLADADRLLLGFAAARHRLPCPDTDRDGLEDCTGTEQKGWLPYRTIGLEGTGSTAGLGQLRYLVQRQAVNLTVATDTWQPVQFKNNTDKYTGTRTYTPSNVSTPDLCGKLVSGQGVVPLGATHAQLLSTPPRAVAYALAHPGKRDEGGSGSLFDAGNAAAGVSLEPPGRSTAASSYDDRVTERSYAGLALALDCARLTASLDLLSLATEVVEEVESQEEWNTTMASILTAVNLVKTGVAVYKTTAAATQLGTATGYLATASGMLAAAIASCAVLVGCFEIPHAAASVAAASVSIGVSSAAIVASAVGAGLAATASALTLSAAIMAGLSTASDMDISAAVASSLTSRNNATTEKNTAYTAWQNALADEATALGQKNAKIADFYAAARSIVASGNSAATSAASNGRGRAPAIKAADYLDAFVLATITKADAWMAAEKNYQDAKEVYDNAVKLNSGGPTGTNSDITATLAALDAAIAAEPDPVKKQALMDVKAATIAGSTSTASNSQQRTQLTAQITSLDGQITDLNAQIAAAPTDTALVSRRDQLVAQRAQVQSQLNTLSQDVPSTLATMNLMDGLRTAARNEYQAARDAAVAAARLVYQVETCTTTITGTPPSTTTTTTCSTSDYVYDGRTAMSDAARALYDRPEYIFLLNDPFYWVANEGVYFQWKSKQQKTLAAQVAYDKKVVNEQQAIDAYNRISAISGGSSSGTGLSSTTWNGAQALLIWADRKGGMR